MTVRSETLRWQTLYHCRKIAGEPGRSLDLSGYLPNPLGEAAAGATSGSVKEVPVGSSQHVTAGPYSPVLRVRATELVVISGQVGVAPDGSVRSDDFTAQTEDTLENCFRQLSSAGLGPADVFKVNVYLTDLANWDAFNTVYRERFPDPKPVRTAVGTQLLPGILVEVELWAAR